MTFTIKSEYRYSYPAQIRGYVFRFVSASLHPTLYTWHVLGTAPDGEFYTFKREHIKVITPLEVVLE